MMNTLDYLAVIVVAAELTVVWLLMENHLPGILERWLDQHTCSYCHTSNLFLFDVCRESPPHGFVSVYDYKQITGQDYVQS